ncbi:MAG: hypothetical protein LBC83_02110 [Oscillospiraceae bacterium]|nr:hypothetical protein [Oscillospiraceae bacterium]
MAVYWEHPASPNNNPFFVKDITIGTQRSSTRMDSVASIKREYLRKPSQPWQRMSFLRGMGMLLLILGGIVWLGLYLINTYTQWLVSIAGESVPAFATDLSKYSGIVALAGATMEVVGIILKAVLKNPKQYPGLYIAMFNNEARFYPCKDIPYIDGTIDEFNRLVQSLRPQTTVTTITGGEGGRVIVNTGSGNNFSDTQNQNSSHQQLSS